MATPLWDILPYARVFAGDVAEDKYADDTILAVLRVTTGVVQTLGYDKAHVADFSEVGPTLTEKEKVLWGKTAAVLLQDPDAMKAALEAVAVRSLGTSYSTEARARFMEAASSRAFAGLRAMIRAMSAPLVGELDDLDIDTLP